MKSDKLEFELVSNEIGYFLRPKQSKWKTLAEDIALGIAIAAFAVFILWLTGIAF